MKTDEPKKILLQDYQQPDFKIIEAEFFFNLNEDFCRVRSILKFIKIGKQNTDLILDGTQLILDEVKLNGRTLNPTQYVRTDAQLTVRQPPEQFTLEISVRIQPQLNTSLEGLYKSGEMLLTQCEAQGFRRITYFLDRPDVMTNYTVHIEADEKKFPLLLSNGDLLAVKKLDNGRHQTTWKDPHKKPCYLFALVAGNLGVVRDTFTTKSGLKINLEVYAPHGQQNRCHHALESLKKSMRWDEERFGCEYDLNTYMIVATDDFNAGAMENKGLNIFNSRLVLADSKSATDDDYFNIESVIAHEYFHNWTGNRVTLRDWFHLSLKEGLTVFRDQEFSMDMSSRSVVRIDSVTDLRKRQFAEDAGPNAHPIRPESCYAVDNFFTATIYEKGSEVIRMMQTMVGRPGFRKGMDLYFRRHDGQAVIIEDFAKCIAEENKQDWQQFQLWYSQAGTPVVAVEEKYNEHEKTFSLTLKQSCREIQNQKTHLPFDIPLMIGLLDPRGQDLPLICSDVSINSEGQSLIHLKEKEQTFIFQKISQRPVLSLNRSFSAPIQLDWKATEADLIFLLAHDSDDFNRWEAGQKLALNQLQKLAKDHRQKKPLDVSENLLNAYQNVVISDLDPAMKAMILELPEDSYILQHEKELDPESMRIARQKLETVIAQKLANEFEQIYKKFHGQNSKSTDPKEFAKRRLKNLALRYLANLPDGEKLAYTQFQNAEIMTDQQAALMILADLETPLRQKALNEFFEQWKNDSLVLNKWFSIQAQSQHQETFSQVQSLIEHPDFHIKNPNRVYSLLLRFGENLTQFHRLDINAYEFMADQILKLDQINPQVATRVSTTFAVWTKLPEEQKKKARAALERLARAQLSKNTFEIISRTLSAK